MLRLKYPLRIPETIASILEHTDPRFQTDTRHEITNKANKVYNGIDSDYRDWIELLIHRSEEQFFFIFSKDEEKEMLYQSLPENFFKEKVQDSVKKYGIYEKDINNIVECLFNYTPNTYHMLMCGVTTNELKEITGNPKISLGRALTAAMNEQNICNTMINANGDLLVGTKLLGKILSVAVNDSYRYEEIYLIFNYIPEEFNYIQVSEKLMKQACWSAVEVKRDVDGFTGLKNECSEFNEEKFWKTVLNLLITGKR